MIVRFALLPLSVLLCCSLVATRVASLEPGGIGDQLTSKSLDRWLHHILPEPEELRWRDIPWRAQYWDAIIEGQEKERPILIWAMNGHPLGCT